MGKVVSGSFPPMTEPRAVEHVIPTIKLRMAKEHVLNEVNRINKEHGHFKASASGNPTLAYGKGHDMKHHGEGQEYASDHDKEFGITKDMRQKSDNHKKFSHITDPKPANDAIQPNMELVEKYRKDNPHLYKDDIND